MKPLRIGTAAVALASFAALAPAEAGGYGEGLSCRAFQELTASMSTDTEIAQASQQRVAPVTTPQATQSTTGATTGAAQDAMKTKAEEEEMKKKEQESQKK